MTTCPTCHLPTALHDCGCTVPARPLRTALLALQVYRLALAATPLNYQARSEMLAQVDKQVAYLEGIANEVC
jgi:hypothetical protein